MLSIETYIEEVRTVPAHMPGVTFDIDLDQHIDHADFDYMNYQAYALEVQRIPVEQLQKLEIFLTHQSLGGNPKTTGRFGWSNKRPELEEKFRIEVKIQHGLGTELASQCATETLIHETKHFADYIHNVYPWRMSKVGILATRAVYGKTPWEVGARKAVRKYRENPHTHNEKLVRVY